MTFTISPEIRRGRYHDPWSLEPDEHFWGYRFTQSGVVNGETWLPDYLRSSGAVFAYVEPGVDIEGLESDQRALVRFSRSRRPSSPALPPPPHTPGRCTSTCSARR